MLIGNLPLHSTTSTTAAALGEFCLFLRENHRDASLVAPRALVHGNGGNQESDFFLFFFHKLFFQKVCLEGKVLR